MLLQTRYIIRSVRRGSVVIYLIEDDGLHVAKQHGFYRNPIFETGGSFNIIFKLRYYEHTLVTTLTLGHLLLIRRICMTGISGSSFRKQQLTFLVTSHNKLYQSITKV